MNKIKFVDENGNKWKCKFAIVDEDGKELNDFNVNFENGDLIFKKNAEIIEPTIENFIDGKYQIQCTSDYQISIITNDSRFKSIQQTAATISCKGISDHNADLNNKFVSIINGYNHYSNFRYFKDNKQIFDFKDIKWIIEPTLENFIDGKYAISGIDEQILKITNQFALINIQNKYVPSIDLHLKDCNPPKTCVYITGMIIDGFPLIKHYKQFEYVNEYICHGTPFFNFEDIPWLNIDINDQNFFEGEYIVVCNGIQAAMFSDAFRSFIDYKFSASIILNNLLEKQDSIFMRVDSKNDMFISNNKIKDEESNLPIIRFKDADWIMNKIKLDSNSDLAFIAGAYCIQCTKEDQFIELSDALYNYDIRESSNKDTGEFCDGCYAYIENNKLHRTKYRPHKFIYEKLIVPYDDIIWTVD